MTDSGTSSRRMLLSGVLLLNAGATLAASVVLAFAPEAIPRMAGIASSPSLRPLAWLLAASELAIAALAALAARSRNAEVQTIAVRALVVFHLTSAISAIASMLEGARGQALLLSGGAHLMMIFLLAWAAREVMSRTNTTGGG